MNASAANVDLLERVAARLLHLRERVVFLGGATTSLFVTDAATPPMRPTDDVDVIVEVASTMEYKTTLRSELLALGFAEDVEGPNCRWIVDGAKLDVMPVDEAVLGYTNEWYAAAIRAARPFTLPSGTVIRLVSATHFVATKLAAFENRGDGDFEASPDIEDVMAVVDGRSELAAEAKAAAADLRRYLGERFARLLANPRFNEALPGHLGYDGAGRLTTVNARLQLLADLERE